VNLAPETAGRAPDMDHGFERPSPLSGLDRRLAYPPNTFAKLLSARLFN
jgi:hypothetical protein